MDDDQIMERLRWLYRERENCRWCRHPRKKVSARGLCASCIKFARAFRKNPTVSLAVAIDIALREGTVNALEWPITGLELETLLERVSAMAFPWRKDTDNPFWHEANTWGESFSEAQRRLLFHYFSLITREAQRRFRRVRADGMARFEMSTEEREQAVRRANQAMSEVYADSAP
jgi:hypothetical protein